MNLNNTDKATRLDYIQDGLVLASYLALLVTEYFLGKILFIRFEYDLKIFLYQFKWLENEVLLTIMAGIVTLVIFLTLIYINNKIVDIIILAFRRVFRSNNKKN